MTLALWGKPSTQVITNHAFSSDTNVHTFTGNHCHSCGFLVGFGEFSLRDEESLLPAVHRASNISTNASWGPIQSFRHQRQRGHWLLYTVQQKGNSGVLIFTQTLIIQQPNICYWQTFLMMELDCDRAQCLQVCVLSWDLFVLPPKTCFVLFFLNSASNLKSYSITFCSGMLWCQLLCWPHSHHTLLSDTPNRCVPIHSAHWRLLVAIPAAGVWL